jgi:hypothetical protein
LCGHGDALSLGKAAELAEMNRIVFGEMVGQRGIARVQKFRGKLEALSPTLKTAKPKAHRSQYRLARRAGIH